MNRILSLIVMLILSSVLFISCGTMGGMVSTMMDNGIVGNEPAEETKMENESQQEVVYEAFDTEEITLVAGKENVLDYGIYSGDFRPEAEGAVIDGSGSSLEGNLYIWANDLTITNLTVVGSVNVEFNNCTLGEGVVIKGDVMIQGTGTDYSKAKIEGEVLEKR